MTDIDTVVLSPEERLAAELPRILNFYVLPPRVVGDKFWLHLANEILATLDAARKQHVEDVNKAYDEGVRAARADRDGLREAALELLYALDGLGPMGIRNAKHALRSALTAEAGPRE